MNFTRKILVFKKLNWTDGFLTFDQYQSNEMCFTPEHYSFSVEKLELQALTLVCTHASTCSFSRKGIKFATILECIYNYFVTKL